MKKYLKSWSVQQLRALIMVLLIFNITPAFAEGDSLASPASPVFSLTNSEYPSWSVYSVAEVLGLINGEEGKKGTIEEKWDVDMVLRVLQYPECISAYGSYAVDAACLTNMDSIILSLQRATVVPFATSTSFGGDQLIVGKDITNLLQLKGVDVYGEGLSIAQFVYWWQVEAAGEDPALYPFVSMANMDAAAAMLVDNVKAVQIWNPNALELRNQRPDLRVLADTRSLPGIVLDMVAFGKEVLERPGGANFVYAVIDTYLEVSSQLRMDYKDPEQRDFVTGELGKKFCSLNVESMRKCLTQTLFYDTLEKNLSLMTGGAAFPTGDVDTNGNIEVINRRVAEATVRYRFIESVPTIGYGPKQEGAEDVQIRFDPSYLQYMAAQK